MPITNEEKEQLAEKKQLEREPQGIRCSRHLGKYFHVTAHTKTYSRNDRRTSSNTSRSLRSLKLHR